MKIRRLMLASTLGVVQLGCLGLGGPTKPLFEGKQAGPEEPLPPPPPRPYEETPQEELLAILRQPQGADERKLVLEELIGRGEESRALLQVALDQELILAGLLGDALDRLDGAPDPARPPVNTARAPWLDDKLRLARDRFASGDLYGTLRLVEALQAVEPFAERHQAEEMRRLRRESLARLVRENVVIARLEPRPRRLSSRQRLEVTLEIENLSGEDMELEVGGDGTLGFLNLGFELLPWLNSSQRRGEQQSRVIPVDDDIEIAAGETWRYTIDLGPQPHTRMPPGLVGRYSLGGWVRPQVIKVGDSVHSLFLPLLPTDVLVVHHEDGDLYDDPAGGFLTALDDGLSKVDERRVRGAQRAFVAALVLADRDREAALTAVHRALLTIEEEGLLSDSLCAALGRIVDEPLGGNREEWLEWLERSK